MSATLHPKLFLQAVLARPSLSHKHCLGLFKATAQAAHDFDPNLPPPPPADELETRWNDFRHRLNTQLEELGLQLTQVTDEGDKGRWVVLVRSPSLLLLGSTDDDPPSLRHQVNTESDDLALLATVYTPLELTYLKLLVCPPCLSPSCRPLTPSRACGVVESRSKPSSSPLHTPTRSRASMRADLSVDCRTSTRSRGRGRRTWLSGSSVVDGSTCQSPFPISPLSSDASLPSPGKNEQD